MHRVPTRADLLDRCAAIRGAMREEARLLAACVEARQSTRGIAIMGDFWRRDLRATQRALLKVRNTLDGAVYQGRRALPAGAASPLEGQGSSVLRPSPRYRVRS